MRILIIDDDAGHGESLVELVSSRGHEAYFASSYADAEWLLQLFRFDLSVVDYDLPDLTGAQVARQLAAHSPEMDVVIVSAHEPADLVKALPRTLPFFSKPIQAVPFLAFVDRLVVRRLGAAVVVRESYPLAPYRPKT